MRMNTRGQALIEFVLILPVLIFLLFLIVDFGRIMYSKNHLENLNDDVINLLGENKSYEEIVKFLNEKNNTSLIKLDLTYGSDSNLTIEIKEEITLLTPGLNLILDDPYYAKVKRVVLYE